MLADPIREFCNTNNYEVIENYSGSTFLGEMVTTLTLIVKPDRNFLTHWNSCPASWRQSWRQRRLTILPSKNSKVRMWIMYIQILLTQMQ